MVVGLELLIEAERSRKLKEIRGEQWLVVVLVLELLILRLVTVQSS